MHFDVCGINKAGVIRSEGRVRRMYLDLPILESSRRGIMKTIRSDGDVCGWHFEWTTLQIDTRGVGEFVKSFFLSCWLQPREDVVQHAVEEGGGMYGVEVQGGEREAEA